MATPAHHLMMIVIAISLLLILVYGPMGLQEISHQKPHRYPQQSHIITRAVRQQLSKGKPWLQYFRTRGREVKQQEPLVCSIALLNTGKYVLITTGFRGLEVNFSGCTINNDVVYGRRIGPDIFECEEFSPIKEDDVLSIRLSDIGIVPSLAVWSDRTPMSLGNHPKIPLCIVTMMKDEEGRIADWIEYHTKQGVGLFLVYNNNSTDNTLSDLQRYTHVVVIDWPWKKSQNEIILHGPLHMKNICQWVFHIDVDEYIFPAADKAKFTVIEIMYDLTKWVIGNKTIASTTAIDHVCLRSKVMGTSGYIKCPKLPTTEAYIDFDRWRNRKCAVRPRHIIPGGIVHRFLASGESVLLSRKVAHLVHYKYQCWEYFMTKYYKGRSSGNVQDYNISELDKDRPELPWTKLGPRATAFRDYKRIVDKWPLQSIWLNDKIFP